MATKGQKLSKPQEELLRGLPRRVVENYAPVKKLVAMGLASMVDGSGSTGNPQYVRTQAGDDWVNSHPVL